MADKTRQIGGILTSTDEKGTLYTVKLFINNADKATYTPSSAGKAPTPGQSGASYMSGVILPSATYIYEYEFRPIADHWILTIQACNTDYLWDTTSSESVDVINGGVRNRSFEQVYMLFPARWWGIITYDKWKSCSSNTGTPLIYTGSRAVANGDDLVYFNATDGTAGSFVASECFSHTDLPFTQASTSLTNMPLRWVNQRIAIIQYTVTYWRAASNTFTSYLAWKGINGNFTPPTNCAPSGYTTAGMWRSVDQKIREAAAPTGSLTPKYYDEITRVMHLAPGSLRWSEDKCGATWSW